MSDFSQFRDGLKYTLVVVQHPRRARSCGFGDKVSNDSLVLSVCDHKIHYSSFLLVHQISDNIAGSKNSESASNCKVDCDEC